MISKNVPVKPSGHRKVTIRFMDISVSLEGSRNVEKRALKILSVLVGDRVKVAEVMSELDHEDEPAELKPKKTSLKDNYNLSFYQ